ncbi:uncharacterized protein Triagg1_855 [Trichoderma aggressivum f. europaeum]|uniref:Nephrocystin 3-like N-terminal domain-containing protein n=1 Tax=Trichoderma aggressivum f. europaeum TaxID=173218 RepID=A0AAE1JEE6_9HYPO|nr:hypothetical protein Triagg1_855 [Trichoderma aggressivum f. europaeum]
MMSTTANSSSPSTFQSQEKSLWEAALRKLPDSERLLIIVENGNKLEILHQILALAEGKKEICLQRRWKFKKKEGEIVIIRDKLEKITTWITRFNEVGSTVVQYDPLHAAVPWAGILIILQVAMNDAQTFGAMVDGVERVSSILPSKKLSDVESCLLIVQLEETEATSAKTEKITQYLSALGKPIIRSSAQLTELHKSLSRQEKTRILNWLSQINTRYHHQLEGKDHLPGSGNWLLEHPEFIRWQDTSSSAILWLHGIPGCGKTKLAHRIVQKLLQDNTLSPNPAPVAYFYCARNPAEPNRSSPDEVFRSILKQLSINDQGEIKDIIVKEFKARDKESELYDTDILSLSPSDTQDMMSRLFERDPATIVIDALDECDPARRHKLLSALGDILRQSPSVIKIMVTSRDDGDICCHLSSSPNIYIRADDNRLDIERFIDYTLSQALANKRLLHGKMLNDLVQEVSITLKDKAQGMFRWVTLQIDNLCDSGRIKIESDVREEVGQLPQTLRESYDRSYRHILDLSRPSRVLAERVFKWLLCAQKLMTTEELVAAIIFASEHHFISSKNILDICYNMVVIDDQGDAFEDWVSDVWNLHQSSQAFEVEEWLLERLECIASPSASPLFLACTFGLVWLLDMMQASKWTEWDLLNYRNEGAILLACKWGNVQVLTWILEQLTISPSTMVEALSVAIECERHDIAKRLIEQGANAYGEVQAKNSPLLAATVAGSVDIVSSILSENKQFEAHAFAEAMAFAYTKDRDDLFQIFWKRCTSLKACHYFQLVLAIQEIVLKDNPFVHGLQDLEELFGALLEFSRHSRLPGLHLIYQLYGIMGDSFQNLGVLRNGTLIASSPVTSEDVSRMLVERRTNPPREDLYNFLASALSLAGDNIEVFEMLLDLGAASVRGLTEYLCLDKSEEIILGHWEEVWHFFDLLREPNAEIASKKMRLLLDHGLNINVTDHNGRTPLMLATKSRPSIRLDTLLGGHANIELFDHKGQNALAHALNHENEPAMATLIDHGADANSSVSANSYISALQFVTSNVCNYSLIDILREKNARRPGHVAIDDYLNVPFLASVSTSCKECVAVRNGGV